MPDTEQKGMAGKGSWKIVSSFPFAIPGFPNSQLGIAFLERLIIDNEAWAFLA
jgi:hypothetical protein